MLPEPLASYDIGSVAGQPASHLIDVAQNSAAGDEDLQPLAPLWKVEKRVIERAIAHCRGNVAVAAAHLGVSASTIYRKKKQWEEGDTGVI
jgi:DNA-binding NtrC family response regulator